MSKKTGHFNPYTDLSPGLRGRGYRHVLSDDDRYAIEAHRAMQARERARDNLDRLREQERYSRQPGGPSAPQVDGPNDPALSLLALIAGPEAIMAHAQTQVTRTACKNLPCSGTYGPDSDVWVAAGFKLGEPIADDHNQSLFRHAEWPAGWALGPVDDSGIWRHILDEQGRPRGAYGYKGAFWDPFAACRLDRRYGISYASCTAKNVGLPALPEYARVIEDHAHDWRSKQRIFMIFEAPPVTPVKPEYLSQERFDANLQYHADLQRGDASNALALAWLNENRPNHNDRNAYWDMP